MKSYRHVTCLRIWGSCCYNEVLIHERVEKHCSIYSVEDIHIQWGYSYIQWGSIYLGFHLTECHAWVIEVSSWWLHLLEVPLFLLKHALFRDQITIVQETGAGNIWEKKEEAFMKPKIPNPYAFGPLSPLFCPRRWIWGSYPKTKMSAEGLEHRWEAELTESFMESS